MPTLIKRYANRRLYDTEASHYITLEDLARTIIDGREVKVIDAKTTEDLTRRVLLQVLLTDDQAHKLECLPVEFLRTLITLQDHSLRKLFERYVSVTLNSFTVAQKAMQQNLEMLSKMAPLPGDLMSMVAPWLKKEPDEHEES